MQLLLDALSWLFLISGGLAVVVGSLGLVRLPDFYTRLHSAGITDTLGTGLILIGLTFQAGFTLVTVKLLFIAIFVLITSPTSTHAVAKAALHGNLKPEQREEGGVSSKN